MHSKKLLWQLYPSYLIIMLFSLVAVTWYATDTLREFALHQTAAELTANARLLADQITKQLVAKNHEAVDRLCRHYGRVSGTRFTVVSTNGAVIGDSETNPENLSNYSDRPEIVSALSNMVSREIRRPRGTPDEIMYVAIPLQTNGKVVGAMQASIPMSELELVTKEMYVRIAASGLIVAALVAIGSWLVVRRITRPLKEMRRGVEFFAGGHLDHRLPAPGIVELEGLATAFNAMAFQLRERIDTITGQRNEREAILSSMTEGVLAIDENERIISINRAASDILHLTTAVWEGRSVYEVVRNTSLQHFVRQTLSASEPREDEIVLHTEKKDRIIHTTGTVLRDPTGTRIGAVIVLNDVTRIRQLENMRREFVANVSHELRTPITSIKGFVETLMEMDPEEISAAPRFLQTITRQTDRLNAIIEDLMLLSRLDQESDKRQIPLRNRRIKKVLLSAIDTCSMRANEKGVTVELECPDDLIGAVERRLLEQAVVNLIDNAIKYTEGDEPVRVTARRDNDRIVIAVTDHGCGIPEEHHARLFERFYRVDRARSRKLGGTGLGLAIVKHIVQAHYGSIGVRSAPGEGSSFFIYLPSQTTILTNDEVSRSAGS